MAIGEINDFFIAPASAIELHHLVAQILGNASSDPAVAEPGDYWSESRHWTSIVCSTIGKGLLD